MFDYLPTVCKAVDWVFSAWIFNELTVYGIIWGSDSLTLVQFETLWQVSVMFMLWDPVEFLLFIFHSFFSRRPNMIPITPSLSLLNTLTYALALVHKPCQHALFHQFVLLSEWISYSFYPCPEFSENHWEYHIRVMVWSYRAWSSLNCFGFYHSRLKSTSTVKQIMSDMTQRYMWPLHTE